MMHPFARAGWRSWAVVALGLGLAAMLPAQSKPHAADLSLRNLAGQRVRLRHLRGQLVVLNFWATWCGPCRAEMPLLVAAEKQYDAQGVVFIGISLDDRRSQNDIPAFLERYGVRYAIWLGADADTLSEFHLGDAVPDTAFLDRRGVIRFRILGEMRPGELQERLNWLLQQGNAPAPPAKVVHLANLKNH